MSYETRRVEPARVPNQSNSTSTTESSQHQLLQHYLALTKKSRDLEFVTTSRASKKVGLSQRTIQFWVQIGRVDAVFIGRKWLVSVKSLVEYLENQAEQHELL